MALELIQEFIERNGAINLFDRVLYTASGHWYVEIVETIVDAGVDFKIEDDEQLIVLIIVGGCF